MPSKSPDRSAVESDDGHGHVPSRYLSPGSANPGPLRPAGGSIDMGLAYAVLWLRAMGENKLATDLTVKVARRNPGVLMAWLQSVPRIPETV
jgi:hypothetical protein